MPRLVISDALIEQIVSHCKSVHPHEACGIVAGKGGVAGKVYTMTNVEHSNVSYMMDSGEQFRVLKEMREEGTEMIAIFHSHPHSPAYPSSKDVNLAVYEEPIYMIIGLSDFEKPEIRAFEIAEGRVREIRVEVAVNIDDIK